MAFFNSKAVAPDSIGGAELRFHGVRATDSDGVIDEFSAHCKELSTLTKGWAISTR